MSQKIIYKTKAWFNYGFLLIGILSFYINYIDFNFIKIDPSLDIPFINDYSLETIPTIIEPISKQNAAKTIYKIFDVIDCLRSVYEDIFKILEKNSDNNLIFQLFHLALIVKLKRSDSDILVPFS